MFFFSHRARKCDIGNGVCIGEWIILFNFAD